LLTVNGALEGVFFGLFLAAAICAVFGVEVFLEPNFFAGAVTDFFAIVFVAAVFFVVFAIQGFLRALRALILNRLYLLNLCKIKHLNCNNSGWKLYL
jgi:uncharacterized membrane protein